jgi:hypothetical protein
VLRGLVPAMVIALALPAVWYVPMLEGVLNLLQEAEKWSVVQYGFDHVAPSFWWYARTAPGALSIFFSGLLIVGCAAILLLRSRVDKPAIAIVALFGGCIYVGLSGRQGSLAWMHLALGLPVVAVLTAVGVMVLVESISSARGLAPTGIATARQKWRVRLSKGLANAIILVCVGMACLNYLIVDWGTPRSLAVWQLLGSPLGETCEKRLNLAFCPNPPVGGDWKSSEILQAVLDDPDCQRRQCTLVIVANWRDNFSYSHLRYHLAQDFPRAQLAIQRAVASRPSIAWLTGEYVVYLTQWDGDAYQDAIIDVLETPPGPYEGLFQEVKLFPLPNGYTARLLRRTRAITADDAAELVGLLGVPESVDEELKAQAEALREPTAAATGS